MSKLNIFAAAFAAMFAIGCTNDSNLGSDILPSTDKPNIIVIDTVTIKTCTITGDTIDAGQQNTLIVGELKDNVFGKTSASFAAQFSNSSYGIFPEGAICDSVVLTLGVSGNKYYGDSTVTTSLDVYKISSPIYADSVYKWDFDASTIIGDKISNLTFVPANCDSVISFNLDKTYGDEIIAACQNETYEDQIYGIVVKPADDNQGNCIIKSYYNNDATEYIVYYHLEGDEQSSSVIFSISQYYDARFNMFSNDFSSAAFYQQLQDEDFIDENLYLQCMGGTKIKVEFPYLKNFNNLDGKYLLLSRAQLICPLGDTIMDGINYAPMNNIVCQGQYKNTNLTKYFDEFLLTTTSSYYDSDGTLQYYTSSTLKYLYYDATNHQYSINLTERVEDLLETYKNGSEPDYDIYLYPDGRVADFRRAILNSPTNSSNPMKLVVEYVIYDK